MYLSLVAVVRIIVIVMFIVIVICFFIISKIILESNNKTNLVIAALFIQTTFAIVLTGLSYTLSKYNVELIKKNNMKCPEYEEITVYKLKK